MGLVQCMTCRQELPCPCSARAQVPDMDMPYHERVMAALDIGPRRSRAVPPLVPGELDQKAQERLWDAMMREQREDN